ncbi:LysE family translocator [Demequina sp. NBRC 110052]|uniref:LysE family translocator n=1 Tax=Demequina sp. NBRC 110052 TaxID=1570341 RepID=UPI0009FF2B88|nr:LysE family translocator [Demequina sp. NBRC 110052]
MDQFLAVALAHFLALIIPGVDFFLIVRTAAARGWRSASGVCVGIAMANGAFIVAAFGGLGAIQSPVVLSWIELVGGAFLLWMGVSFWRTRVSLTLGHVDVTGGMSWVRHLGMGAASGLLNPKNLLFYVSLAAVVSNASAGWLVVYGTWMFLVVLGWDLFVALVMGSDRSRARLAGALPVITRAAAVVVALFGIGAIVASVTSLVS